jgi:hypothetical protein
MARNSSSRGVSFQRNLDDQRRSFAGAALDQQRPVQLFDPFAHGRETVAAGEQRVGRRRADASAVVLHIQHHHERAPDPMDRFDYSLNHHQGEAIVCCFWPP